MGGSLSKIHEKLGAAAPMKVAVKRISSPRHALVLSALNDRMGSNISTLCVFWSVQCEIVSVVYRVTS